MSIEAQYYSIPLALAGSFLLSTWLAYRTINHRQLTVGQRIIAWVGWLFVTCCLLAILDTVALLWFFFTHPMEPANFGS